MDLSKFKPEEADCSASFVTIEGTVSLAQFCSCKGAVTSWRRNTEQIQCVECNTVKNIKPRTRTGKYINEPQQIQANGTWK